MDNTCTFLGESELFMYTSSLLKSNRNYLYIHDKKNVILLTVTIIILQEFIMVVL